MSNQKERPIPKIDEDATVRRVPQQQRSRRKVARILETAMKLFQESGMDLVSMREIARESDLPIATVYQYFPNKQSIVRQIWEQHTSSLENLLQTELAALSDDPSSHTIERVIDRIVDSLVDSHENNPALMEIRRCIDVTPELRRLNFEDTLRVAEFIQQAIVRVNPDADESALASYALIITEAASSTVKLGQQMSAVERTELYSSLKLFLSHFFRSLGQ